MKHWKKIFTSCEQIKICSSTTAIFIVHSSLKDPPQKVWLDAPAQDVPLNAGTKVTLICHSTGGNPTPTLTWLKVILCWKFWGWRESACCSMSLIPVLEWKGSGPRTQADILWHGCGQRTTPGPNTKWQHGHIPLWCHKQCKEDHLCTR